MMKLKDCFSTVRGSILMTEPLPKVAHAYRIFAQEERHQEVAQLSSHNESLAFVADKKPYKPYQNNPTYNKPAYNKSQNLTGNKRPGAHYYCTHCKVPGHSMERCFRIHGFPPGFKGFKDKRVAALTHSNDVHDSDNNTSEVKHDSISIDQFNQLMSLLQQQPSSSRAQAVDTQHTSGHALVACTYCLLSSSNNTWLLDSSATDHICSTLTLFHSYSPTKTSDHHITIPDGRQIPVSHIDPVQLTKDIKLHNVLHIPDFEFNLISVHKLCHDLNCQIIFTHDSCFLQGQT